MSIQRAQIRESTPSALLSSGVIQRKCACGQHAIGGGGCAECAQKNLQRSELSSRAQGQVLPIATVTSAKGGATQNADKVQDVTIQDACYGGAGGSLLSSFIY